MFAEMGDMNEEIESLYGFDPHPLWFVCFVELEEGNEIVCFIDFGVIIEEFYGV